jgi:hypothetical protein
MIDLSSNDISGMEIWQGTWFRVNVRNAGQSSTARGYINIQSWEEDSQGLHAILFTEISKGEWQLAELMLHYASGTPLRFLCWFEYAEEFAFSLSINASTDRNGYLRRAVIRAVGLTHLDNVDEYSFDSDDEFLEDGEEDDTSSKGKPDNDSFSINGLMVNEFQVPVAIIDQCGDSCAGQSSYVSQERQERSLKSRQEAGRGSFRVKRK